VCALALGGAGGLGPPASAQVDVAPAGGERFAPPRCGRQQKLDQTRLERRIAVEMADQPGEF